MSAVPVPAKPERDDGVMSEPQSPAQPIVRVLPRTATEPAESSASSPLHVTYTQTAVRNDLGSRLMLCAGVVRRDRSELAESFRMLRTQVLQRLRQDKHTVLAVTSARPAQGKSLTALNLALTITAEQDCTVLLVDADLSGTGLQSLFGLSGLNGLGEHLGQALPLPELLINPGVDRFVLLPAGCGSHLDSAELLASRAAQQLVQELRARYTDRIIIFDLPPLLEQADTLAFLPQTQASLLVVEQGTTASADLELAAQLLAPFNLIGSVLSRPAPRPSKRRWLPPLPWLRKAQDTHG